MSGYIPLWFRFICGGFVPWCFWFTCPFWANLTVWLQHTLYSRVSSSEPRFSAGPYHHPCCSIHLHCRVLRAHVNGDEFACASLNDISLNIIVYHSFMFIPCQGNVWKPYKLRVFWVGFRVLFFHQFYNLVWSKSNVLSSRPLKYLCNGRAMDDSFPFLNSSCSMLLLLMQAKTDWMIQTWEHENLGRI
jgi:hypothetical protein